MGTSLSARIAAAMQQASEESVDKTALGGLLMTFEDEAASRRQFLGITQAYLELNFYDMAERASDKALEAPGDKDEEFIAYHFKGRALWYQGNVLYDEGQKDAARHVYEHAIESFSKSIHKGAPVQFALGSLLNSAHVHFCLENYEHTIGCITLFMKYQKKTGEELHESVIDDLADLLTRARNELRAQKGYGNDGSN